MGTLCAIRANETAGIRRVPRHPRPPETRGTRRAYASTLHALRAEFGDDADTGTLEAVHVGAWFTRHWGSAAPATWNRNLDALRSAQRYWQDQRWMTVIDLNRARR